MLITKVKVGKVTNLSEARYCAGMGVDFLSFPVSSVDPKTFQEITGWVAGPKFGIEVNGADEDIKKYTTDFICIDSDELRSMPSEQKAFIYLSVNEWFEKKAILKSQREKIIAIELTAHSFDDLKKIIEEMANEFEVFLKVSSPSILKDILQLPIAGISLEGNSETKPGLKEYPLAEILERLETES